MSKNLFPALPVLIVDDEEAILMSLSGVLKSGGIDNIGCIQDSREVIPLLQKADVGLMLLDLTMPHLSGEELLSQIREEFPDLAVIIITGNTEVATAVMCMKIGAFDYLVKPVESSKLLATVKRAIEIQQLKQENRTLKDHLFSNTLENPDAFSEIITSEDKMLSVLMYVEAIAKTTQTVLITGETGVGKELVAKAIHTLSDCTGELVAVNVAGFDDNMFGDTLFGHKKGAFTGAEDVRQGLVEAAAGGTLFLDEIGDLSHTSQVKLLRLLEEHEYMPLGSDVAKRSEARIVVATNKDVDKAVEKGEVRKDLYYRLRTHLVHVPPLRERKGDISLLISYFLRKAAVELNIKAPAVPRELNILLMNYGFPGNVRELKSMIYDAMSHPNYLSSGVNRKRSGILSLDSFKKAIGRESMRNSLNGNSQLPVSFSEKLPTIRQATDLLIVEALKRARGRQTIASQLLGISQQALSKRMQRRKI
jgi:DNA-binding NtrC family response regulator